MPAYAMRMCRSSGRETESRIGTKDARADQAESIDADQQWSPGPAATWMQDASHARCARADQQAGDNQIAYLNPAELAISKQTEIMSEKIVARASERLGQSYDEIEGACDHSAGQ